MTRTENHMVKLWKKSLYKLKTDDKIKYENKEKFEKSRKISF